MEALSEKLRFVESESGESLRLVNGYYGFWLESDVKGEKQRIGE